jgi:hypothetical protein
MTDAVRRLRLILGAFADPALAAPLSADPALADMDRHLGYLYDRAYQGRGMRPERSAGLGQTALEAPDWLAHVQHAARALRAVAGDQYRQLGRRAGHHLPHLAEPEPGKGRLIRWASGVDLAR